jgi:hypothetical protein
MRQEGNKPIALFVQESICGLATGICLYHQYIKEGRDVKVLAMPVRLPLKRNAMINGFVQNGYECVCVAEGEFSVPCRHITPEQVLLQQAKNKDPFLSSMACAGLEFLRGADISDTAKHIGALLGLYGITGVTKAPSDIQKELAAGYVEQYLHEVQKTAHRITAKVSKGLSISASVYCDWFADSFFCGILRSCLYQRGGKASLAVVDRNSSKIFLVSQDSQEVTSCFIQRTQTLANWAYDTTLSIYVGLLKSKRGVKEKLLQAYNEALQDYNVNSMLSSYGLTNKRQKVAVR